MTADSGPVIERLSKRHRNVSFRAATGRMTALAGPNAAGKSLARAAAGKSLGRAAAGRSLGRAAGGRSLGRAAGGRSLGRAAGGRSLGRPVAGRSLGRAGAGKSVGRAAGATAVLGSRRYRELDPPMRTVGAVVDGSGAAQAFGG
jgi:hypothetical protein